MPDIRNLTGQPTGGVRQFELAAVPGQPTRIRTWGIPTGPGYWDRPGKWNLVLLPIDLKEDLARVEVRDWVIYGY